MKYLLIGVILAVAGMLGAGAMRIFFWPEPSEIYISCGFSITNATSRFSTESDGGSHLSITYNRTGTNETDHIVLDYVKSVQPQLKEWPGKPMLWEQVAKKGTE